VQREKLKGCWLKSSVVKTWDKLKSQHQLPKNNKLTQARLNLKIMAELFFCDPKTKLLREKRRWSLMWMKHSCTHHSMKPTRLTLYYQSTSRVECTTSTCKLDLIVVNLSTKLASTLKWLFLLPPFRNMLFHWWTFLISKMLLLKDFLENTAPITMDNLLKICKELADHLNRLLLSITHQIATSFSRRMAFQS
jgi:hypothetical protein